MAVAMIGGEVVAILVLVLRAQKKQHSLLHWNAQLFRSPLSPQDLGLCLAHTKLSDMFVDRLITFGSIMSLSKMQYKLFYQLYIIVFGTSLDYSLSSDT